MATPTEIQQIAEDRATALIDAIAEEATELLNRAKELNEFDPFAVGPEIDLPLIDDDRAFASVVTNFVSRTLEPPSSNTNELPDIPGLGDVQQPSIPTPPSFDDVAPTINVPSVPSNSLPSAPGNSPEFNAPAIPNKPTIALPQVPSLAGIEIPSVPTVDLPAFDATLPIDQLTEPTTSFDFVEHNYSSDILETIKAKLLGDLRNGGYGIEPNDELALWERARERELKAADAAIDEATAQIASRGFILPPGALFHTQQIAEQDALDKASTLNREIALARSDLYLKNRQFVIQQSQNLEAILIQYHGARAERALNAAKAQVEVGISLYNLRVQKFQALLDSYRTQATVYETRIRANLVALESFKAQIEGVRAAIDVQALLVNVYKTQVEAANIGINLYRTEMEAAQIQASVEKLKLEAFRSSVEAYTAQVGAREAEFKMFEAQIRGEISKVEAYKASADAYGAKVGAIKVQAEAQDIIAKTKLAENAQKLDLYRAQIEGFKTEMERNVLDEKALQERIRTNMDYEKVVDSREQIRKELFIEKSKYNSSIYAEDTRLRIQKAQISLNGFIELQKMSQSGMTSSILAKAQMAAASLSSLSAVVSQTASGTTA